MKTIIKIISAILLIFICAAMYLMGEASRAERYNLICPDIDTNFSTNYNEKLFKSINIGEDTTTIIAKIGHPLEVYKLGEKELQWNYTSDGKCKWGDFAWLLRAIVIDDTGKVCKKYQKICYD